MRRPLDWMLAGWVLLVVGTNGCKSPGDGRAQSELDRAIQQERLVQESRNPRGEADIQGLRWGENQRHSLDPWFRDDKD